MAKNWAPTIASAQAKITNFGRSVTFVQFDTTPDDVAKPWNAAADVRTTPASTLVIDAVFVPPSGVTFLGQSSDATELLRRVEQVMIVSPGATDNLKDYQEVIDTDGSRWRVTMVEILQPANDVVLCYVGVRR